MPSLLDYWASGSRNDRLGTSAAMLLAAVLVLISGCARPRSSTSGADCFLSPPPTATAQPSELLLELGQSVESAHAPVPTNDAEAVVFRQLYETLTEIDCEGKLHGRLGEGWDSDAEARVWTVTLAPRRFWDGSALRAGDVVASWRASSLRGDPDRIPFCWIELNRISVVDDRRIRIELPTPMRDFPRALAHPALAVGSPRNDSVWPVGSGTFRVGSARGPLVQCEPNPYAWPAAAPGRVPRLAFRVRPGSDARDLPEREPVSRRVWSRKAIAFLASRGMQVERLPWSRRYLLLLPDPLLLPIDRGDITRAVTDSEAEPTATLGWSDLPCRELALPLLEPQSGRGWDFEDSGLGADIPGAPVDVPAGTSPLSKEPVVLALSSDPDAVAIAERVASRASAQLGSRVSARGVGDLPFHTALGAGRAFAFVVALPLDAEATCLAPSKLALAAPWLLDGWEHAVRQAHPAGASRILAEELERFLIDSGQVVVLLRTGASLVGAQGLVGVRIDGGGLPRFGRAAWGRGGSLP